MAAWWRRTQHAPHTFPHIIITAHTHTFHASSSSSSRHALRTTCMHSCHTHATLLSTLATLTPHAGPQLGERPDCFWASRPDCLLLFHSARCVLLTTARPNYQRQAAWKRPLMVAVRWGSSLPPSELLVAWPGVLAAAGDWAWCWRPTRSRSPWRFASREEIEKIGPRWRRAVRGERTHACEAPGRAKLGGRVEAEETEEAWG